MQVVSFEMFNKKNKKKSDFSVFDLIGTDEGRIPGISCI